jgi:hypothetical protein
MSQIESHLEQFIQKTSEPDAISVKKIGEGFNASGYSIQTIRNGTEQKLFARELSPSVLGATTPEDQAFSLLESSRTVQGALPSRVYGIKQNGEFVEVTGIQKYISIGQHLPDGSVNFLGLIERKDDSEEASEIAFEIEPLAMQMTDLLVAIHDEDLEELPSPAELLYSRATAAIIHNSELGRGVVDLLLSQNPEWVTPDDTDLLLSLMIKTRRMLGVHPERLTKIHGDYWQANIFFTPNGEILTGDIRTGWGEPADDVVSMIADLCAHDLIQYGSFGNDFTELSKKMLKRYIETRRDPEITKYMALKYSFKTLAEATFTPGITDEQRRMLFATGIGALTDSLEGNSFDVDCLNEYCQKGLQQLI